MNIWLELRRRRVFRLAGMYIVGAWLALQVADILFPAWGIPDPAIRYLVVAAVTCFPLALIFSWFFDVTSSGVVRTPPADIDPKIDLSLRGIDYGILAALALIAIAVIGESAGRIKDVSDESDRDRERLDRSVAVLPFTNLDTSADTRFFSDGVTEEILHRLASLGTVHVLASNSSFAFRNTEQTSHEIARALGVSYLLRGSVRREDINLRISAQLIDRHGFTVWSNTFDRELNNVFVIQSEIASAVASLVVDELIPIRSLPDGRTTVNMRAYNEYLAGKAHFDARRAGWRDAAVAAFETAMELDPGFAPAYAGKAMSIAINAGLGPHIDEALLLAQNALALDPGLAEAHAITGLILSFPTEQRDFSASEASLRRALDANPSLAIAYNWLYFSLNEQGRAREAHDVLLQGLAVDPLNGPMVANAAAFESRAGNFERAEQLLLRMLTIPDPPVMIRFTLVSLYSDWGRTASAMRVGRDIIRHAPELNPVFIEDIVSTYDLLGMPAIADKWFALLGEHYGHNLAWSDQRMHQLMIRGDRQALAEELLVNASLAASEDASDNLGHLGLRMDAMVQVGRCHSAFDAILTQIEPDFDWLANEFGPDAAASVLLPLAYCHRQLNRHAEADQILTELAAYMTERTLEASDPLVLVDYALIKTLRGDSAGAIALLDDAAQLGWSDFLALENNVMWQGLNTAPGYEQLREKVRIAWEEQRRLVQQDDTQHDFLAEVTTRLNSVR